ncbi:class I SAM-dependent methyltransferase [Alkalisalibacterium limincola]|uniref:Class I SAM-dependent methyltransferase n=1 Tax=Alkalisalibacterium limincola TaxID=2699169 RepID=A0A5C8KYL1_9GAMM|nr:SAM-dependent methyltransferase [Alkalisalibacterium limincola]TXK65154.1 class I SAM-dependent methyltransferase [Alkalisalibacterium limincola]
MIAAEVRASGSVPFSRFMELALYAPGLGYYSAGATKFGAAGDFITAPELGPLFAECIAQATAPVLSALGASADLVELGGGSGVFARDVLEHLAALDALPARYRILEPSADLRERQRGLLADALPASVFARVEWLDGPPQTAWRGVLFANEVLDALPTPRFVIRAGEVMEEHVGVDGDGAFHVLERPADALLSAAVRHAEADLGRRFDEGYRSELLPQLPYWIQAVGGLIDAGAMLFVDYGYPRGEYYLPERRDGTLVCHYRHRAHADPFFRPGLQDLTAFVDFTALAEAGTRAGFDLSGYCAQAAFLMNNGLVERLEARQGLPEAERHRFSLEAKRLTLPGEMGERFQVMGFERGVDFTAAFAQGDLSRRL